ncbi:uncharacterized protein RCC_06065 [Ramularia collo-cygni]|uniref:Hydrophobin n=1 Tax=Ramularia collo-cygni TaxID=112498 RepID=A0A2D3UXQ3_9PEZI|nr:uncharacterized protein RCC_06065 [Ramularia collo-cygni]CZT20208.1 uncharacterized protein RCC_06065 [Ramularia collo-cygni]
MQYYTLLTILAGAAAVSAAGLTDDLVGSSGLTGSAGDDSNASAAGGLTDELVGSKSLAGSAENDKKFAFLDSLGPLGLKQVLKPGPYDDTVYYAEKPSPVPVFITRTLTTTTPTHFVEPPKNIEASEDSAIVESCSEGTAASCCDTKGSSGDILSNVLGGSCALSNLNIPILAAGGLSGGQCNQGNTFCCPINQEGNLNIALACIPIFL